MNDAFGGGVQIPGFFSGIGGRKWVGSTVCAGGGEGGRERIWMTGDKAEHWVDGIAPLFVGNGGWGNVQWIGRKSNLRSATCHYAHLLGRNGRSYLKKRRKSIFGCGLCDEKTRELV
jgi:hypothetical protein